MLQTGAGPQDGSLAHTLLTSGLPSSGEGSTAASQEGQPATALQGGAEPQTPGVPDIELTEEDDGRQPYPVLNPNVVPGKKRDAVRPISHGSRARWKRATGRLADERAPW
jgi:hypothetical protein